MLRATSLLFVAVGCGGTGAVAPSPATEPLQAGVPLTATVSAGASKFYEVRGGSAQCVALGPLSASAALSVFGDSAFTHSLCAKGAAAGPAECLLPAPVSPLYVEVAAGPAPLSFELAAFLFVSPFAAEGSPQSPIPVGAARAGEVGTRATSYYQTGALGPGDHLIALRCLTGAADLHVYADSTFSLERDCTLRTNPGATSCTVTGAGTFFFSVSSGAINRDGAGYIAGAR